MVAEEGRLPTWPGLRRAARTPSGCSTGSSASPPFALPSQKLPAISRRVGTRGHRRRLANPPRRPVDDAPGPRRTGDRGPLAAAGPLPRRRAADKCGGRSTRDQRRDRRRGVRGMRWLPGPRDPARLETPTLAMPPRILAGTEGAGGDWAGGDGRPDRLRASAIKDLAPFGLPARVMSRDRDISLASPLSLRGATIRLISRPTRPRFLRRANSRNIRQALLLPRNGVDQRSRQGTSSNTRHGRVPLTSSRATAGMPLPGTNETAVARRISRGVFATANERGCAASSSCTSSPAT